VLTLARSDREGEVPQEEDRVTSVVRNVVLTELSWVVAQPMDVISDDDHLAHAICASASDLAFDFIPFVQRALDVCVPAAAWSEACTVGQACELLTSHYRQKPAQERAVIEARLASLKPSPGGEKLRRRRYYWRLSSWLPLKSSYWYSPFARWRRLGRFWRSWRGKARRLRRALQAGPMFAPRAVPALHVTGDETDAAFALVRDVVFWSLEGLTERRRETMSLDDDLEDRPYIESGPFLDLFIPQLEYLLDVNVSRREWSNNRTIRQVCHVLARHYRTKPAEERAAIEAEAREARVDQYNEPSPRRWWEFWRWRLPRLPD
jgi:hypothetical protein